MAPGARTRRTGSRTCRRDEPIDELVFGVVDDPESQKQPVVAFVPDRDGNMAVYGTGGSGKSAFLRAIAVAAAFAPARGGPCHVYGLDFGSRGLQCWRLCRMSAR